mgnify:CR=1 FL=1
MKSALIAAVAEKQHETSLLDLAVGKGGDMNKWIQSKLKAVLGIDIAYDNIHNNSDGACARYIDLQEKHQRLPICMFIHGDTSRRMDNGDFEFQESQEDEEDSKLPGSYTILQALMGSSHTPKSQMSVPFLIQNYGLFKDKFDVCSIQFALHYMFESKEKLHNFLTNVSQYTKTGKYFIGTCYDGKKIYDLLKEKQEGEMVELYENDTIHRNGGIFVYWMHKRVYRRRETSLGCTTSQKLKCHNGKIHAYNNKKYTDNPTSVCKSIGQA